MGLDLDYIDGQTPLDEDEKEGLLINTISTRAELDEFEQQNIEQAIQWTLMRNFKKQDVLTESFIIELHKRMYGNVWKWAGEFRKTNKNIGVDKWQITIELRNLLDDAKYWIDNKIYSEEEIAVRIKHRIVSIHCFPNGNGRHSRLMADIIIEKIFTQNVFSWGVANLSTDSNARGKYLKAVKEADKGNYKDLLKFAWS
jgi:Fic-DOC domain mobile mystery protein B